MLFFGVLITYCYPSNSPILGYSTIDKKEAMHMAYLKYATTHEVVPMLRGLCSECHWIVLHSKQAIGLVTSKSKWDRFRQAILALDKRRDLIRLEVDVIEINNVLSKRYQHVFSQLTQPIMFNQAIETMIQLMISSGNANIISSPRLIGRSGQLVELKVGDQVPYKTTIQNTTSIQNSIQYIQSGIELKITPYTHYGQRIDLDIDLEYSAVTGYRIENGTEMPVIATRRSKLNLQITANSTIIFAGLLDQSKHNTIEKVPILGDIPIVGELFQKKIVTRRTSDLVYKIRASLIH